MKSDKKVRDANRDNVFTPAQIVKDKRQKKQWKTEENNEAQIRTINAIKYGLDNFLGYFSG